MKAKHALEHIVFNSWKKNTKIKNLNFGNSKIVVAVSGGGDSMALLQSLIQCFDKAKLVIAHCHHGTGQVTHFRDKASDLVRAFCKKNNLTFELGLSQVPLDSEAAFREFRLDYFETICRKHSATILVMAHHRNDWLEGQLLKLIRGSSFTALRKNFQWSWVKNRNFFIWRPLIDSNQAEVRAYLLSKNIPFIEDPSNSQSLYLRNWLRNIWLPLLEAKRPGAVNRLALSLINSLQELNIAETAYPWDFEANRIDILYLLTLSEPEKLRCLAYYFQAKGAKGIKSSQLREVIKQLDKNKDNYHIHFKTFNCQINAGQLMIQIH